MTKGTVKFYNEKKGFGFIEPASELLLGTYLEVDEERFNGKQIRVLYESKDYVRRDRHNKLRRIRGLIDCSAPTKRS